MPTRVDVHKVNLRQRTFLGIIWKFGASLYLQMASLVVASILAHLLSPEEFGLIGIVTVFTGFAMVVGELGLSAALVQRKNLQDKHISSAFYLNVVFGLFLTVLFFLTAPVIANFYEIEKLNEIIKWLSLSFLFTSLSITQRALLQKRMEFSKIGLSEGVSVSAGGVCALIMAFSGFGVWALVGQRLTKAATESLMLWLTGKRKIPIQFSFRHMKEILPFSMNLTGFKCVSYFSRNVDYLLIGKLLGTQDLGYYTIAYKLMLYPIANISWVIASVMFPALAEIQDDKERLRRVFLKMNRGVALVSFPAVMGLFVLAPEIITVFAGSEWIKAVPLVRILCVTGLIQSITTIAGNLRLSLGYVNLHLKLGILDAVGVGISVLIGVRWGLTGVAIMYTAFNIMFSVISSYLSLKVVNITLLQLLKSLFYPFTIGLFVAMIIKVFDSVQSISSVWVELALLLPVSAVSYFSILIALKQIRIVNGKKIVLGF